MLAPANAGFAKQRQVEHRALLAALDDHEQHDQHSGADQEGHDLRRAPALFVALDEREHEQEQRPGERHAGRASRRRARCGSRDSDTCVSVSATAPMPIGTLTKKIHSQPMPEVITPPMTGPTATAAPITPP